MSDSDLDALNAAIGRTQDASAIITEELVRRFHATLDRDGAAASRGETAPLAIHFCLAPVVVPTALLREDGHPASSDFLPAPFPRRMWAGGELTLLRPLLVGQTVDRRSRIADVHQKQGRSGRLCFVTVEHLISVDGEVAIRERQDIVFRELETGPSTPVKPTPSADSGQYQRDADPSATLLFRYSALTFNSHRIHYDRSYAAEIEHYPGLVVHGPLQATMLLQFAADLHGGQPPRRFAFRSASPLFDHGPFMLHARQTSNGLELWTAGRDGPVSMSAQAEW